MEEKKSVRVGKYVLLSITMFFVGLISTYLVFHFYPDLVIKNISEIRETVKVNENGIADGITNIYDAVVVVESYNNRGLIGSGSGFVYSEDGKIMTNHHVVEGAVSAKVTLSSGEVIDADIVGSDEYADIAVLKIDKKYVKKVAILSTSESTSVGDTVFTIGSPIGKEFSGTVTRGIISGKDRMVSVSLSDSSTNDWIMNVMQTDAAINPGNSGGPLCNVSGEVIGINSLKIVQSSIEGIGFAIPIEDALEYAKAIENGEEVQRAYLGIEMLEASNTYYLMREGIEIDSSITEGVVVVTSVENGPSAKAGLKKGDVIVKIGDYNVKTVAELRYYLYKHSPGEKIDVEAYRGKKIEKFTITLGKST